MTTLTTKAIITTFHHQLVARDDFAQADDYLSPQVILHTPFLASPLVGSDKFCDFMTDIFAAMTELKVTTNEVIAEGDKAVVRWTIEGVSSHDFMNIPPGGDKRAICIMSIYHLSRGKVTEVWTVDSSMWPRVFDF